MPARLAAALLALLALAPAAHAASAPDAGTPFAPKPVSEALYGTKAPAADEATQQKVLQGEDGTDLFVETWLPAAKVGATPPARIPTILVMTPYVQEGQERYPARNLAPVIAYFTARGYAVAQHHVRGTGSSGGCLEQTATQQIKDAALVIEYLGRDAPWTNGAVGMYGHSYDAETQVSVAGRGDPAKVQYLKAIVPSATVGGQYEYSNIDGVPYAGQALLSNSTYLATTSLAPGEAPIDANTLERFGCQPEILGASPDVSGDLTPYWRVREYRPEAGLVKAATLWVHGLDDFNVMPVTVNAFFDRLPATTPHKAIFGQWEHNYPDVHPGVQPDWARADFLPAVTAWYDRYLKGVPTGVEAWPGVQLQGSDGAWKGEPGFPQTGGPAGQLALGPEGKLGAAAPTGATSFTEGADDAETVPGTSAVFETAPVTAPLELSGQPVLDTWLTTDTPDAHLTAKLQVLGADGAILEHAGSSSQEHGTFGARSLQHLDPMPDGFFAQATPKPAPTGEPLRVGLRMIPTDLVVPVGGRLRLTVAGATDWARQTLPSGNAAAIELLHDCAHPSALRFLMPHADAPLLDVRETDETGPLTGTATPAGLRDGDGLASAPVCGKAAERPEGSGPATPAVGATTQADPGPAGPGTPTPTDPATVPGTTDPAPTVPVTNDLPASGSPNEGPAASPGSQPAASSTPAAGAGAGAGAAAGTASCRDALAPTTRPARRRVAGGRLVVTGAAADRSACAGAPSGVARVLVSVARRSGSACRFLGPAGLGAPRPCARTEGSYRLARRSGSSFSLRTARLPRGSYVVWTRAIDAAGNVERKAATRNLARVAVR